MPHVGGLLLDTSRSVPAFGRVIGLLIGFAALMPSVTFAATVPILKSDAVPPPVATSTHASMLVIDVASGKTLYAFQPSKAWVPASLTKLMTAETFTATPTKWDAKGNILKADEVGGGRLSVPAGSRMTLRDLMYSAIVGSANNAAEAMARIDGPGRASFVRKMNERAQYLGLANTHFNDASGMNEKNITTAYDMANIFLEAGGDVEVKRAMTSASYQFKVASLAKNVKNTNLLVTTDPSVIVTGGKTGYLVESRYNFVLSAKPGPTQPQTAGEVAVLVFGAPSRDDSQVTSANLAKWAWNAFDWKTATPMTVTFTRNLGKGDKGADVKALQKFLNTHGAQITASGAGSPGNETELFGDLTRVALIRYQELHAKEILEPQGKKKGTGYLDLATRAFINEIK